MLVLSRKKGERIIISDNIELVVVDIRGDNVRIGISAPKEVVVVRAELINNENKNIRTDEQRG